MSSPHAIVRVLTLGQSNPALRYEYNEVHKSLWAGLQRDPAGDEGLLDKFEHEPDLYTIDFLAMLEATRVGDDPEVDYGLRRLKDAIDRGAHPVDAVRMDNSDRNVVGDHNVVDHSVHITRGDLASPGTALRRAREFLDDRNYGSAQEILHKAELQFHDLTLEQRAKINYLQALSLLRGAPWSQQGAQGKDVGNEALRRLKVAYDLQPEWLPVQILWAAVDRDFRRNNAPQEVGRSPLQGDPMVAYLDLVDDAKSDLAPFMERFSDADWQKLQREHKESALARLQPAIKYFYPIPVKPSGWFRHTRIALIGITLLYCVLRAISEAKAGSGDAVVLILVAAAVGYPTRWFVGGYIADWIWYVRRTWARRGRATDQQMDDWMELDLRTLQLNVLARFNNGDLTMSQSPPHVAYGPAESTYYQLGDDGRWRFSRYALVVVCMADRQFAARSCEWDMTRTQALGDVRTRICRYSDVSLLDIFEVHVPIIRMQFDSPADRTEKTGKAEKGGPAPEALPGLDLTGRLELSIKGAGAPIRIAMSAEQNGEEQNITGAGADEVLRAFQNRTNT